MLVAVTVAGCARDRLLVEGWISQPWTGPLGEGSHEQLFRGGASTRCSGNVRRLCRAATVLDGYQGVRDHAVRLEASFPLDQLGSRSRRIDRVLSSSVWSAEHDHR